MRSDSEWRRRENRFQRRLCNDMFRRGPVFCRFMDPDRILKTGPGKVANHFLDTSIFFAFLPLGCVPQGLRLDAGRRTLLDRISEGISGISRRFPRRFVPGSARVLLPRTTGAHLRGSSDTAIARSSSAPQGRSGLVLSPDRNPDRAENPPMLGVFPSLPPRRPPRDGQTLD